MTAYTKKPWGYELIWAANDKYASRVMIVPEGESTPYIYHKKQDITLFILQGVVILVIEGRNKTLHEGDTYHIPPKIMHQIIALKGDATILESGTPLEDDIIQVEK